jgi:hypothetical protein
MGSILHYLKYKLTALNKIKEGPNKGVFQIYKKDKKGTKKVIRHSIYKNISL